MGGQRGSERYVRASAYSSTAELCTAWETREARVLCMVQLEGAPPHPQVADGDGRLLWDIRLHGCIRAFNAMQ